jgi:hypothetical protein
MENINNNTFIWFLKILDIFNNFVPPMSEKCGANPGSSEVVGGDFWFCSP